jgi:hypothetical protein
MISETEYSIWIVTPTGYTHQQCFNEIATSLHCAFLQLDIDVPVIEDVRRGAGKIITLGSNLLKDVDPDRLPRNLILYNLEQISVGSPWCSENYINLLGRYPVWDYSRANIRALRELGIENVELCEIGYVPELTRIPSGVEDIDVLFIGSMNARRKKILRELKQKGLKVVPLFDVYGEQRDRYISRAKIVVNIHFYEAKIFEIVRVSYLLANKKCVISESGQDKELEGSFSQGVVFTDYDDIVATTLYYLEHEAARRTVAERGYCSIQQRSQTDYLNDLLSL